MVSEATGTDYHQPYETVVRECEPALQSLTYQNRHQLKTLPNKPDTQIQDNGLLYNLKRTRLINLKQRSSFVLICFGAKNKSRAVLLELDLSSMNSSLLRLLSQSNNGRTRRILKHKRL